MARGIKVPISVEAVVVSRRLGSTWTGPTHADPLQQGEPLSDGVHLHWALPDALTEADAAEDSDAVPQFPAVPDVWLVTRFAQGTTGPKRRVAKHWIVDSRTGHTRPLALGWTQPEREADAPRLTAVGFQAEDGTLLQDDAETPLPTTDVEEEGVSAFRAAWAAYYRDGGKRFGFHDSLLDKPAGPLTYSVVGWYADLSDDPVHAAGGPQARFDTLEALGWHIEGLERPEDPWVFFPGIDLKDVIEVLAEMPDIGVLDPAFDPARTGVLTPEPVVPGDVKPDLGNPVRPGVVIDTPVVVPDLRGLGTQFGGLINRGSTSPIKPEARFTLGGRSFTRAVSSKPTSASRTTKRTTPVEARTTVTGARFSLGGGSAPKVLRGTDLVGGTIADKLKDLLDQLPDDTPAFKASAQANLARLSTASGGIAEAVGLSLGGTLTGLGEDLRVPDALEDFVLDPRVHLARELAEDDAGVPDRTYCHGIVVEVDPAGNGTFEQVAGAELDDELTYSLGDTPSECLAKLLSSDPNSRWLLEALGSQVVPTMSSLSGIPRVQQYLHQAGFNSVDGGYTLEEAPQTEDDRLRRAFAAAIDDKSFIGGMASLGMPDVLVGDALALRRDPATHEQGLDAIAALTELAELDGTLLAMASAQPTPQNLLRAFGSGALSAELKQSLNTSADVRRADDPVVRLQDALGRGLDGSPTKNVKLIRRPKPRFWQASAPQVCLQGPRRSQRHGEDGRYDDEGRLLCRATGQRIDAVQLDGGHTVVGPGFLWIEDSTIATMPGSVRELVNEVPLLDPGSAQAADALTNELRKSTPAEIKNARSAIAHQFKTESTFWWNAYRTHVDRAEVLSSSAYIGTLPSLAAINPWKRGWDPLFVEYAVSFHPVAEPWRDSFALHEVEHLPTSNPGPYQAPLSFTGRAFLTPVAADTLATGLAQLAERSATKALDSDLAKARDAALQAQALDVLSFSLDGIDRHLRQAGHRLRAGALQVQQLRLVDAFGQALDLASDRFTADDDDLVTVQGTPMWALPPRLPVHARLLFRLRQAADTSKEATKTDGPVCGFLMTDHVEHAVEVFDGQGRSLGQLRHDDTDTHLVRWEAAPGSEPAYGASGQQIPDPTLRGIVQGMLAHNLQAPPEDDQDTALSALIRVLDTVRHTVARTGESSEHLSSLVGRPVAVVRASLALQTKNNAPLPAGLECHLGSLSQPDDGLLAYFVGEDFGVVHPPHAAVLAGARTSGPRGSHAVPGAPSHASIAHPYVHPDPTVDLPDTRTVHLTLLMEPSAGVHAATGILPRKKITLMREHIDEPMQALAPTFRVGPVLVDPARLDLPLPGFERYRWDWVRRERPAGETDAWRDDPVQPITDAALFAQGLPRVQEGWIQLEREEGRSGPSLPGYVAVGGGHMTRATAGHIGGRTRLLWLATALLACRSNTLPAAPATDTATPLPLIVSIEPFAPRTTDNLAAVVTPPNGPAGIDGSPTYDWYRGTQSNGLEAPTLGRQHTTRGDEWTVRVAWTHEGDVVAQGEATVTIGNVAPVGGTLAATWDYGAETLTCVVDQPAQDEDGDAISYTMRWLVDDVVLVEDTGDAGMALTLSTKGVQAATCEATPSDGADAGADFAVDKARIEVPDIEMIRVEPGTFSMGGDYCFDVYDELGYEYVVNNPVLVYFCPLPHEVTLTRPFYLAKYELDNSVYQQVLGRISPPKDQVHWPASVYTAEDAGRFLNLLSELHGFQPCYATGDGFLELLWDTPYDCPGFRMPTDAEWEFAATDRGHIQSRFAWGDAPTYSTNWAPVIGDCQNVEFEDGTALSDRAHICHPIDNTGNTPAFSVPPLDVTATAEGPMGFHGLFGNLQERTGEGTRRWTDYPPVQLAPTTDPYWPFSSVNNGNNTMTARSAPLTTREYWAMIAQRRSASDVSSDSVLFGSTLRIARTAPPKE